MSKDYCEISYIIDALPFGKISITLMVMVANGSACEAPHNGLALAAGVLVTHAGYGFTIRRRQALLYPTLLAQRDVCTAFQLASDGALDCRSRRSFGLGPMMGSSCEKSTVDSDHCPCCIV